MRNTLLLLNDEQRKYGVVAASWGNHGCAVSYHATQMGIPSIVVMPLLAAVTKVNNCEKLGAKLILFGDNIAEAKHHAMAIAKEKKMMYLNGLDILHIKLIQFFLYYIIEQHKFVDRRGVTVTSFLIQNSLSFFVGAIFTHRHLRLTYKNNRI